MHAALSLGAGGTGGAWGTARVFPGSLGDSPRVSWLSAIHKQHRLIRVFRAAVGVIWLAGTATLPRLQVAA